MQFRTLEPGIEVNGQTVYTIVDGFRLFRRLASAVLQCEGIGRMRSDGDLEIDRSGWYPQEAWLRAFERIAEEAGTGALQTIGRQIPENAIFPPTVVDVPTAIESVDIAYHLNHRKGGEIMLDQRTGAKLDGIGNYDCARVGGREIMSRCNTPYPCDFDRGILLAMARKFERHARVEHVDWAGCRKHGRDACTYQITW